MSRVEERDEQEALKLDEHFKRTLTHIRTYVLNLNSVEETHLCGIWLEKLNSTILQRNLRNEYLLELSRQLKAGTLAGIFKTKPPNDLLMPLPSFYHAVCISSSLNELSEHDRSHQNCVTSSRKLDQRSGLRNKLKIYDYNSSANAYFACRHNGNTTDKNHLKFYKYRINMLTTKLENLQIQNERLKKELTKCRGNTVDNEASRLRNRVGQLTTQAQTHSLAWKVRVLKKTIAKLRKLNDTVKHVYEKKLQHIIRVLKIHEEIILFL
ncbi:uncharacterized protein LOC105202939 [Solenopsis invicta]|uniref:uncharacterized protein LOC105202939 n=1 Tax=Solenopsis invicta TaxID=13686 RepID=UPI00193E2286|nr:uncharacterized protein LOC105202939 [Solenopsis invicta]